VVGSRRRRRSGLFGPAGRADRCNEGVDVLLAFSISSSSLLTMALGSGCPEQIRFRQKNETGKKLDTCTEPCEHSSCGHAEKPGGRFQVFVGNPKIGRFVCSDKKGETAKDTFYLTLCTGKQEVDGPRIAVIANGGIGLMSGEPEFRSGPAALARGKKHDAVRRQVPDSARS
jgi:hypothetical protein